MNFGKNMNENIKISNKKRIETGAIKFNDDWTGLFVRGDDCIQLKMIFEKIVNDEELDFFDLKYIQAYLVIINHEVLGEK